ncbi:hypothetical protein [Escherichia phage vB-Eco-KMB14]|nr:hypothetical protein [Escherichia phage vB-Eco-KMB14]
MPTIESRLRADYNRYFSRLHRDYMTHVTVWLDGEIFLVYEYLHDTDDRYDPSSLQVAKSIVEHILKEWPTCDQTSTSELQYRKTITCCCGQLKVIESL